MLAEQAKNASQPVESTEQPDAGAEPEEPQALSVEAPEATDEESVEEPEAPQALSVEAPEATDEEPTEEPGAPQALSVEAPEATDGEPVEEPEAPLEAEEPIGTVDEPESTSTMHGAEESSVSEAQDDSGETEIPGTDEAAEPVAPAAAQATPEAIAAWTEALHSVERSINEAAEAIRFLRSTLQQMTPLLRSLDGLEGALSSFAEPRRPATLHSIDEAPARSTAYAEPSEPPPTPASHDDDTTVAEQDWTAQRRKVTAPQPKERGPKWEETETQWTPPAPSRPAPKPVTLVPDDTPAPYTYRITIEDRKNSVELLQIHRALAGIPSVRNVSLLNYVNGIASLSVDTMEEMQTSELESALKKIMKRSCSVVPHESNVILVQVGD